MNYTSKSESIILLALFLVSLTGASSATERVDNSNQSQLKVALLDFGPLAITAGPSRVTQVQPKMAKKLPYVSLFERERLWAECHPDTERIC